eukprot:3980759-Amphidinium_carterae.1
MQPWILFKRHECCHPHSQMWSQWAQIYSVVKVMRITCVVATVCLTFLLCCGVSSAQCTRACSNVCA